MKNELENFCKAQTGKVVNWDKALNDVKKQIDAGRLDSNMLHDYIEKSGSWVTCACGNLCDAIPRDEDDVPEDYQLFELGADFPRPWGNLAKIADCQGDGNLGKEAARVAREELKNACEILEKIENRSTQLLIEMGVIPEVPHGK